MRQVVEDIFPSWSEKFEGKVPWMYLDIKGLVTTGIGNLVDTTPAGSTNWSAPRSVLSLPWVFKQDGRAASQPDIAAEWLAVKAHPTAAKQGHRVLEPLTNLRLTDAGIRQLVMGKVREMESLLIQRFPKFNEWPAEAQLATLSMAWACGAAFRFPKLERALLQEHFDTAAEECHIDDRGNPGVTPRNAANRYLYVMANSVVQLEEDREVLRLQDDMIVKPRETPSADFEIVHPQLDLSTAYEASKKDREET